MARALSAAACGACRDHRQTQRHGALHQGVQKGFVPPRLLGRHGAVQQGVVRQADFAQGHHPVTVRPQLVEHRFYLCPGRIGALRVQAQSRPYTRRSLLLQGQNAAIGSQPGARCNGHRHPGLLGLAADGGEVGIGGGVKMAVGVDEGHTPLRGMARQACYCCTRVTLVMDQPVRIRRSWKRRPRCQKRWNFSVTTARPPPCSTVNR